LKLGKSTIKTTEMLHEAFGEHSLTQRVVFEWHSYFKASRMSVEDDIQGNQAPAKRQKMLKKFENSSTTTIAKQSMSLRTSLGSVMEFTPGDLNRKSEYALHCCFITTIHLPTRP
jgi:hypothetical protein